MRNVLIVLSSFFTIAAALPYISDILKRKTKPRVVSWLIWALLTGISAAASLSDKQYAAFVLSLSASIECIAVVLLGLKYGDKDYSRLDIGCFAGAIIGLLLWYIFDSPSIAILAGIIIDLVGAVPTISHAWIDPFEETWMTFAMSAIGAVFAVLAATTVRVTSLANPIYIVIINMILTSVIITRQRKTRASS